MNKQILTAFMIAGLLLASTAQAAIITNAVTGGVVDPAGDETVDIEASGSATLSAVNAVSGLNVIQDWGSGWSGGSNIIDLGVGLPDVRVTSTGADIQNIDFSTRSTSSAGTNDMQMSGATGRTITIDFGTYNGSTFTAAGAAQSTVAWTLINFGAAYLGGNTIEYKTYAGDVLSTQTFAGSNTDNDGNGGHEIFSGYISSSANIGQVVFTMDRGASGSSAIGFDDLAFHAIPEPSTFALFGLAGVATVLGLRRRK